MTKLTLKRSGRVAAAGVLFASLAAAGTAQNAMFIRQLYTDLLGRPADSAALSTWLTFLEHGGIRIQIASAVTSSTEYRTKLIGEMYADYLNRPPVAQEASFFVSVIQQGATDDQVRSCMLGSEEYFKLTGGTNQGFLSKLYQELLGRPIDRLALVSYEGLLANGATRQAVAAAILGSLESERRKVEGWSMRFLRRPADQTMLANYSAGLQAGATDEQVIDLIVSSDEYFKYANPSTRHLPTF